jgi:hypothetical protein
MPVVLHPELVEGRFDRLSAHLSWLPKGFTGSAHISAQSRKTSMLAPKALSLLARSS